ncbi:YiiD C-terminal domain-containing protein [Chitinimonas lacunae]|uniref:YiiD C-terminal domain-containing protein n=1 Tax=Chitinimonas lacunae TaxID=1963018 RepID=A0ABV8MJM0_9NEIS
MNRDWQTLLTSAIPLTRALALRVDTAADGALCFQAPLAPNVNDKGTAFGGSLSAAATVAGWCEVRRLLDLAGYDDRVEVVIQTGTTEYLVPILSDFRLTPHSPDPTATAAFLKLLQRRGLGRIAVEVSIETASGLAARFQGDYVARQSD